MKLHIRATAHRRYYTETGCPRKFLLLHTEEKYKKALGGMLMKLFKRQEEKELETNQRQEIPFDVTIEISRKRTIDQNSLRWSLYTIEANEMNGGQKGSANLIKPEDLYYQDAKDWNPREIIECHEERLLALEKQYYIMDKKPIKNKEGKQVGYRVLCILRNSQLSTVECAQRIEWQFNRMAENGIPIHNSGEILGYLQDHRQYMNDHKIILNDEVLTKEQYKERNPICEADLHTYLGPTADNPSGSGHCAHIKSVGMGRDREDKELDVNHSSNWLHLCHECHIDIWHGKGQDAFLKKFPHLRFKVLTALKQDYDQEEAETPPENSEKSGAGSDLQCSDIESSGEEKKIDSRPILERPGIFVHPESGSIFIQEAGTEWPAEQCIEYLGEATASEEIKALLKANVAANNCTAHDAASVAEQIGINPEEIDPNWNEIF